MAELFHHYHRALGPDFGCTSKPDAEVWEQIPHQGKNRLVAAARLALLELASTAREREDARRYFAKPGEAEWVADTGIRCSRNYEMRKLT
jgi:hypothetical protein